MKFLLYRLLPSILVCALLGLGYIKWQYGMGRSYPDVGAATAAQAIQAEPFIQLDYPPGNIAVSASGHVYYNYHPIAQTQRFTDTTLFEWSDGKSQPFPSSARQKELSGVFGMTIDRQNRIWLIAPASLDRPATKIWAFDLLTRQQVDYYEFPKGVAQFAQDLRVTADGKYILLADPGTFRFTDPKLIVFDITSRATRTALGASPCTVPEDWLIKTPYGPHRVLYGLLNFAVGLDGIEISNDQRWVYLAPMTSSNLCRVPLASVLDNALPPADVARSAEIVGRKPMSDGITVDHNNNVIITDVEHGGLILFDPESKKLTTVTRASNVLWADGVVEGPDSKLYFTDSAIPAYLDQMLGPPNLLDLSGHRPYFIYRVAR